jgi:hypothetical protein
LTVPGGIMSASVTIASRFHGPPSSGNGGYTCGRLAAFLDGPASVRLKVPPPLETPMEVVREEEVVRLVIGEQVVAEAKPAVVDIRPPAPPSYDEAMAAEKRFPGLEAHYYPTCFVCGPDRAEGDGLRIFPGAVSGRELVACGWIPDTSLADADGVLRPEFVWSALDCPGAHSFKWPEQGAILLGELAVKILGSVRAGERCVVAGWEIEHQGRKHFTGTALYGEDGRCVGIGRGTWIEIPQAAT